MNLVRISELSDLIRKLNGVLRELKERKSNLEKEVFGVKSIQERLEAAAESAKNRALSLETIGVRPEFLERLIQPFQNVPDCSGIGSVVDSEISGIDCKIEKTNGEIWNADQEKRQLEMEEP